MSNPFQDLDSEEDELPQLPELVKSQTLGSIYSLKLIMDIVDLFVSKAGSTFHTSISPLDTNLLDGMIDENNPPKEDN